MEQLCNQIASSLAKNKMIIPEEIDFYSYNLLVIFESFLSHCLLLCAAFFWGELLEVIVFIFSFGSIRSFAGGFHCKTALCCNSLSVILVFTLINLEPFAVRFWYIFCFLVFVSLLSILCIGAVNHPNMQWSADEYLRAKRCSRFVAILLYFAFLIISICASKKTYSFYIGSGIVLTAIMLIFQLLQRKGGNEYNE